ncbi:MAG: hypothetical protein Q9181_006324 [Wetmoreana brouardii]
MENPNAQHVSHGTRLVFRERLRSIVDPLLHNARAYRDARTKAERKKCMWSLSNVQWASEQATEHVLDFINQSVNDDIASFLTHPSVTSSDLLASAPEYSTARFGQFAQGIYLLYVRYNIDDATCALYTGTTSSMGIRVEKYAKEVYLVRSGKGDSGRSHGLVRNHLVRPKCSYTFHWLASSPTGSDYRYRYLMETVFMLYLNTIKREDLEARWQSLRSGLPIG